MELQPVDSLKIIQDIIRQRKQKYEENGFFLIFWSVLIALSGIVQFVMLATDYYPKYSWIGWGILMPLGFFISFFSKMREGIRNRKEQKSTDPLDWLWLVAGLGAISCFCLPYSNWKNYEIALLVIYLPFSFVSLAIALHLRISLWIVTSIIGIILTYSVLFLHYGIALPLLCAILACLLFLTPGIQFYSNYKKQKNVHSQLRLAIVSLLIAEEKADFARIKEITKATSGNISVQIQKLEAVGYISVTKSFKDNYPNTEISLTHKGLLAFESYVEALKSYIVVNR